MIFYKKLNSTVFFDVETVPRYKSRDHMEDENPRLYQAWLDREKALRNKHSSDEELNDEEFFKKYTSLFAEYGKVISIALGLVKINDDKIGNYTVKSITDDDEKVVLSKFKNIVDNHKKQNKYSFLAGHNIKGFDITYLGQRYVANGMVLPQHLQVNDKKPWEINHIDTSELWSFGNYQRKFVKLEELACVLGVDTPKGDLDGSQVGELYWSSKDLDRIDTYCKEDVRTVIEIIFKMCNIELDE